VTGGKVSKFAGSQVVEIVLVWSGSWFGARLKTARMAHSGAWGVFLCPKSATKNSWCHCRCDFFLTHLKGFLQVPSTLVRANWPKVFLLRDFISTPKIHQDRGLPQSLETTLKDWVETLYHQNNLKPLMFFRLFFSHGNFRWLWWTPIRRSVFKRTNHLDPKERLVKSAPYRESYAYVVDLASFFFTVDGGCWVATKVEPRVLRKAFLPP